MSELDPIDADDHLPAIPKAGVPVRLSKPQRELLAAIGESPEADRYDLIAYADRATVESLIRKRLIVLRKIPKSRIPGGKISREEARKAIVAVSKRRADREGSPEG